MSIEQQIRRQVVSAIRRAARTTIGPIEAHLRTSYRNAEFVASLTGGLLGGDFGLTAEKAQSVTQEIIDEVAANTTARFVPGSGLIIGSLVVELRPGLSPALISRASYLSSGHTIDWLSWLLRAGSQVVVMDHSVAYGNFPTSRSGKAIMRHDGGMFRVDPAFAGTQEDNVLSRYLCDQAPAILDIMVRGIRRSF